MKKRGGAVRRAVTMYPPDWKTVEAEARRDDTSVSAALRRIVREWAEWKGAREWAERRVREATADPEYDELAANIRKLMKLQAEQTQKEATE